MVHERMTYTYVGIDSHASTHTAVLLTCFYEKLGEVTFTNVPAGFGEFLRRAESKKAEGTSLLFGMEDASSYGRTLASFLRKKGYAVKHVNANLVAQERSGKGLTAQKTDSIDAECVARLLLSRLDKLPNAAPEDKHFILKGMVTHRQSMLKIKTSLKNQLHFFLRTHYPSYRSFFKLIECQSALAFWNKYPSPSTLKGVGVEEVYGLLHEATNQHGKRSKAEQILSLVERDGDTTVEFQGMRDQAVRAIVGQLESVLQEIRQMDGIIAECMEWFPYPLVSMKGIDAVTAAQFVAIIGDVKRFPSAAKLAGYSGVAPITHASGKTDTKFANPRSNRQLNSLFYNLAVHVIVCRGPFKKPTNPVFHEYYHRKLSEGKTKRQAIKCVQRRLVNIVWRMMTYNVPYENPELKEELTEESEEK